MRSEMGVQALTTCAVASDGRHVRINFQDTCGSPMSLTLPTHCARQLIMTLPQLISSALQKELSDDSARAVFPLGRWHVELATSSGYILTMTTQDGFAVSFAVSASDLGDLTTQLRDLCSTGYPRH